MKLGKQNREIFLEFLTELLKEPIPSRIKPKGEIIKEQTKVIEDAIERFNGGKLKRRYKKKYRDNAKDFYFGMYSLLTANKHIEKVSSLKIGLIGADGYEKNITLPLSDTAGDFNKDLFEFMCGYYQKKPVEHYINGLCPNIDSDYIDYGYQHMRKRFNISNDYILTIIPKIELPLFILSHIKKFEQFSKSQRTNSVLTNAQGRFIVKLMHLIGLTHLLPNSKSSLPRYELPQAIQINTIQLKDVEVNKYIKNLHNAISSYNKAISKLDNYLITG